MKWLSMKAAFLSEVSTAKRASELQALSVSPVGVGWEAAGLWVTLWPNLAFLPKVLSFFFTTTSL